MVFAPQNFVVILRRVPSGYFPTSVSQCKTREMNDLFSVFIVTLLKIFVKRAVNTGRKTSAMLEKLWEIKTTK
jgi:hypothetical protein